MSDWTKDWLESITPRVGSRGISLALPEGREDLLFYRRVSTPLPDAPIGKDLCFRCIADDGRLYYCKDDRNGRPIRATEWIATHLADHLGIAVADATILEDDDQQTFFGSKSPTSLANDLELGRLLTTSQLGELGQPTPWLGRYLAGLNAFDCFIDNPDRTFRNFVLDQDGGVRRLCAIDFASARFISNPSAAFPVATENTVRVGTLARKTHGWHIESAMEMVDRIEATPRRVIEEIVGRMPEDWLTDARKEEFCEAWTDGRRHDRLALLRASLKHESDVSVLDH